MYKAPVDEIAFTLKHVAGMAGALESGALGDLGEDLVDAILSEAGRFATEEVAPLGDVGDKQGSRLVDGKVQTPDGWRDLYHSWIGGGWNGLTAPEEFGGQNLPHMLHVAAMEMWNAGSMAFALGPTLTMGAVDALEKHGSEALKATYLPKMVSGEWTGTMNLTEPHAGSDLGVLKTRAERRDDGTYRIFGQKIFITWGEHDFTDNIVHLVLARLPDAPAGTKGISLFLVPKFLVNADGSLGERNDLFCHSLEHKLGIHGSPTCTMIYGDGKFGAEKGAIGYLIGEENRGLACMFTMMNNARLAVGMQGVAIADAATQKAIAFAKERTQGKAPGWSGQGMSPIIEHPDVARMLLTMKALTQGSRAIAYACAHAVDMGHAADGDKAKFWQERSSLLTPIAKSFATDAGVDVASLGIQVHGGMGFIEETGAARYLRDARIAPIYEGTNGIQAIDLVTRKLPLSGGEHVRGFIAELREIGGAVRASNREGFGETAARLDAALDDLSEATEWLIAAVSAGKLSEALAGATACQRLFGLALTGAYLAKGGLAEASDGKDEQRIALSRFAAENMLAETSALKDRVVTGADSLAAARAVLG
ncbi:MULTISPECIES: acyl-CoA dehydrogenase [Ensifer]|jgi:alkylation response protein AidB-like acyl-CoA dehydrogenase|uniref:3-methylmercaptopropionyl-CoA dehydrogenase n=1 Tax=Ensifer canadensis TaxID=555315 RepID=A0AAW4FFR1_9HYPH|nr:MULTISPECIES: acyl-CoA dehydrogenase [Ensifer]AHK43611.1 acyl-CoA dehydrogenase domain protein [Ensifer adhaerens OV14]MDP9628187.1 alkylation response protein AidB-like acyl-CoA dehydrogenase [Ensifer adhaerens]KQU71814.1 acyl-CoA dehydrogenase [Ensifer sp. Root31]KQW62559.1 acyl-CoA dehydrogenase [Ensifer sp. Root1252]KQW84670.1 acyl-CoA dehydrogenase [Ensifer sp. Root127]